MQSILALQALELDASTDAYDYLPAISTVSVQCCTVTYARELYTIGTIGTTGG